MSASRLIQEQHSRETSQFEVRGRSTLNVPRQYEEPTQTPQGRIKIEETRAPNSLTAGPTTKDLPKTPPLLDPRLYPHSTAEERDIRWRLRNSVLFLREELTILKANGMLKANMKTARTSTREERWEIIRKGNEANKEDERREQEQERQQHAREEREGGVSRWSPDTPSGRY
ncbi:MAG: hypothetical protein Q9195_004172 [Heterodermia aff. obscurata]